MNSKACGWKIGWMNRKAYGWKIGNISHKRIMQKLIRGKELLL